MYRNCAVLSLLAVLAGLSGCCNRCHNECGCAGSGASMPPKMAGENTSPIVNAAPTPPAPNVPQITGSYAGRWESGGNPGHGGGLKCVVTEAGPQKWDALFTAEFGPIKDYKIKLEGRQGDGAVLFGSNVDLGVKDGGIFKWTGKATATEFTGKYEGGGDTGSFKMTRVK